jgi:hypothetical protein
MTTAKLIELLATHIIHLGHDVEVHLWRPRDSKPVTHCWVDDENNVINLYSD